MYTTSVSWRRHRLWEEVPSGDLRDDVQRPDHAPDADNRFMLHEALRVLSRGQRAVLVLRFYDDLTESQTAHALGISVGTVKSQTARALNTLRSPRGPLASTQEKFR